MQIFDTLFFFCLLFPFISHIHRGKKSFLKHLFSTFFLGNDLNFSPQEMRKTVSHANFFLPGSTFHTQGFHTKSESTAFYLCLDIDCNEVLHRIYYIMSWLGYGYGFIIVVIEILNCLNLHF